MRGIKIVKRLQNVMSEKSKLFLESYTTKSGQIKNRYISNPDAKVVKTIFHSI